MAALRPVGVNTTFATSATSAKTAAIAQQSDSIRIVAIGTGVHVAVGTEPTATEQDFFVTTTDDQVLSLGIVESQRVVGMTTGATTFLDFPEGTGCPFGIGEAVSLTVVGQSSLDFEHKFIINVLTSSNVGGYYSTRVEIDHDTSSGTAAFNAPSATLRKSIKVAAKTTSGTGTVHIQQVQVS